MMKSNFKEFMSIKGTQSDFLKNPANYILMSLFSIISLWYSFNITVLHTQFKTEIIKNKKELQHLQNELIQAKEIAVELYQNNKANKKVQKLSEYILHKNTKLSEEYALNLASIIYEEVNNFGLQKDLYDIISLIETESTFNNNVRHAISDVKGLGGIYYKWWNEYLKENDIAHNINDLKDPRTNIQAVCSIFLHYKEKHTTNLKALTAYKGLSDLGRKRASYVISNAKKIEKFINS